MNNLINLNQSERTLVFESCARQMHIRPVIIEKDFWVCVVLNYLMNESKFKDFLIFKGGTSLSKCYHIIDRFSEDIDLVLKWDILGYSDDQVFKERSKNQNNKFEEELNQKGSEFIKNKIAPDIEQNLSSKIKGLSVSFGDDPMIIFVNYPNDQKNQYISSQIKLEIGPVAMKTPMEFCEIEPYCNQYLNESFEKMKFSVPTISLARTFFEKLLILYSETNRPLEKAMPLRYFRHYYDVVKIFESSYFPEIIKMSDLFEEVKFFKNKYYRNNWSKLEECSLKTIPLYPSDKRLKELENDYHKMKEMFFRELPSFANIIHEIRHLEDQIHSIYQK